MIWANPIYICILIIFIKIKIKNMLNNIEPSVYVLEQVLENRNIIY